MTFQDLTNIAREILFGEATDAELAEFHFWSEWEKAVVNYEGKLAVVETVDPDDDAVWLLVVYGPTRFDQHWITTADCDYLYQPVIQNETPAFADASL